MTNISKPTPDNNSDFVVGDVVAYERVDFVAVLDRHFSKLEKLA